MRKGAVLLASLCCLLGTPAGWAGTFAFRRGPLELRLDETTGALVEVRYGQESIAQDSVERSPTSFSVGPSDAAVWAENLRPTRRLVSRQEIGEGLLELTVRIGEYELRERYRLHSDTARIDRSASLTNRGATTSKLRFFTFRTPGIRLSSGGFFRFPKQWPPTSYRLADLPVGASRSGSGSIAPLVIQLTGSRSLVWASCTDDSPNVRVENRGGKVDVIQGLQAAGYLRPGERQDLGFVSMQVVEGDYWSSLPRFWDWMASAGIGVPKDRPKWCEGAVFYSFHPGGTIGSDFRDLGGFRAASEKLLPTLPGLGVTAVWLLPVEYRSPYWPLDYYRFMDGLGNGDDYRKLVADAHRLGLHVLQDLVPHGGAPQAVHNRKHPEFMLRREDGTTLNYWLNDFAWPSWQEFIGQVAAHYIRTYDVDGYRVDACGGSKEANWNPEIPYARASLAQLWGGLGMLRTIRHEVTSLKPREGAILAEVESTRHAAVSDILFDFGFCYNVCHQWRKMPAERFVAALAEYLEEQKYTDPPGTIRLRHIESHDSLRSQQWYGVDGMRTIYALSAWIDGVPMIYQEMEHGHPRELRAINEVRRTRPEIARGEAFYRAVSCDAPGVFACLRKYGDQASVVAINFNREPVQAVLAWPGGRASIRLAPLQYAVVPQGGVPVILPEVSSSSEPPSEHHPVETSVLAFPDARSWFVDTVEGRLQDQFRLRHDAVLPRAASSIYWRPQGTNIVWQNETAPLHPAQPRLGIQGGDSRWTILTFPGPVGQNVQLVESWNGKKGLHVVGLEGLKVASHASVDVPPCPSAEYVSPSGVHLRCIGPDYLVTSKSYALVLRRQGGVIRQWRMDGRILAENQDFYGDQRAFTAPDASRIDASDDVECGIRIWESPDGLHLAFEGQLRGFQRFAIHRPPLRYRNEYVFRAGPGFRQRWAFRSDKPIENAAAFLACTVDVAGSDRFAFLTPDGKTVQGTLGEPSRRQAETKGGPAPQQVTFLNGEQPQWKLASIGVPPEVGCNAFVLGGRLYLALLDDRNGRMDKDRWYEFSADWTTEGR